MAETNKKSLGHKIQKNPALLVFIIIVFAVVIFAVANITSAIQEKSKENNETTTEVITEKQEETDTTSAEAGAVSKDYNIKKFSTDIKSVATENDENSVSLKVEYKDKASLLKTHYAQDVNNAQAVPVFCFYLKDGTQVKCPGELRLLEDSNTAVYTLSVINDYANAVALTDEITVNYDNILDNAFNLYLQNKNDGTGKTLLGTYGKTVEDMSLTVTEKANVSNVTQGIKTVEITKSDEFVWVDIYYNDITSYTELNNDFITNFVCFGFEKGGVNFKRDFITTEYDSLNMVRCKFDSYSLKGLADEMGAGDITVNDLFTDYVISVWTSDYDKDTTLFTIN